MLDLTTARSRMLNSARRLATEVIATHDAAGRVLAEPLRAPVAIPRFDASTMDGYALARGALPAQGPWRLPLRGESAAGRVPPPLEPATAMRIFTGAPMPQGADCVVMQEHVTVRDGFVHGEALPDPLANVRMRGSDLAEGALALAEGQRLHPASLALLCVLDRAVVTVARAPRVTILCTGDELRAPGSADTPGSVPESNAPGIAALAARAGAQVTVAPVVRDDEAATREAVRRALAQSDLLLTIGGVSVGDRDLVRAALEQCGVTLDFWRVAIKPGKPLAFGTHGDARVLALPGNPASSLVTFALFGVPLLRALQGDARPIAREQQVSLSRPLRRSPDRLLAVLASYTDDGAVVTPHANQSSGAAVALAQSDGLALVPPGEGLTADSAHVRFVSWANL